MKGFTLIELLVVVLIIGILAAIGLPQYEIVVEKSRATEALINAKALRDACQRHMQEFPDDDCANANKLADVQLKGGSWNEEKTCFTTKKFAYVIGGDSLTVYRMQQPACSGGDKLYTVVYGFGSSFDAGVTSSDFGDEDSDYHSIKRIFTDL